MSSLARLLAVALIGWGLSTAWDLTPTARAGLPPVNPPPPIDPLPDPDPVDPPDPDPCTCPCHCHDTPEPATLTLLALGGAFVGLRALRRRTIES
jgi:hypothetical protein